MTAIPEVLTLRARLERPRRTTTWRVEALQPAGTRVMLAAQFKSGKTTLIDGLARSLVDREPFLGQHAVLPLSGKVCIVDAEMSEPQLDDWLRDQRVRNDDRIVVIPLRGRIGAFDLLNPNVRAEWAALFRHHGVSYLILDCLRPVLDVLGLDEQNQAGRFLVAFDALLADAGIPEALVVHHMGHAGERSRGDSRIRDWPDVEWRLIRQDESPASPRFLIAYGRDVDVPESRLAFDPATRRLTIVGGSRRESNSTAALNEIVNVLRAGTDTSGAVIALSGRAIKTKLAGSAYQRDAIDAALRTGVRNGVLTVTPGQRNAKLYRPSECSEVSEQCPTDGQGECPSVYKTRTLDAHSVKAVSEANEQANEQAKANEQAHA